MQLLLQRCLAYLANITHFDQGPSQPPSSRQLAVPVQLPGWQSDSPAFRNETNSTAFNPQDPQVSILVQGPGHSPKTRRRGLAGKRLSQATQQCLGQ